MMFKSKFHPGIIDGSVTRTYRYWKRPQGVAGNFYKVNPIGHIRVTSAKTVSPTKISTAHAKSSGFESRKELLDYLDQFKSADNELYCVEFVYEAGALTRNLING